MAINPNFSKSASSHIILQIVWAIATLCFALNENNTKWTSTAAYSKGSTRAKEEFFIYVDSKERSKMVYLTLQASKQK